MENFDTNYLFTDNKLSHVDNQYIKEIKITCLNGNVYSLTEFGDAELELNSNEFFDRVNFYIHDAKLTLYGYDDTIYKELRTVNDCLKILRFLLNQYSSPNEESCVEQFNSTQDMAKYFKTMVDIIMKYIEVEMRNERFGDGE